MGDRGADLGDHRCGEGTERETGDGGRRFVASEPVEEGGEDGQGACGSWRCCPSRGSCGSPQRSSRARPAGRRSSASSRDRAGRQVGLVDAVAAVLSDHQAPAQGVHARGRDRRRGTRTRRREARTRAHRGCGWPRRRRSGRSRRPSPRHGNRRSPVRRPGLPW